MNKFMVSLATLAIVSSFSVSAASLDVHGDIKINGKVVIDETGTVIANDNSLINIAEYWPSGTSTITLEQVSPSGMISLQKFYYVDGVQIKEEAYGNGKLRWSLEWSERTENSYVSTEYSNNDFGTECTTVTKNIFDISNAYPKVKLGSTTSRADKYTSTIITSTCHPESTGKKSTASDIYLLTPVAKYDYKYGDGKQINDCLLVDFNAPWVDMSEPRTLCKNVGIAEIGSSYPYELKMIEN